MLEMQCNANAVNAIQMLEMQCNAVNTIQCNARLAAVEKHIAHGEVGKWAAPTDSS